MHKTYNTTAATGSGKLKFEYAECFTIHKANQIVKLSYPAWVKDSSNATIIKAYLGQFTLQTLKNALADTEPDQEVSFTICNKASLGNESSEEDRTICLVNESEIDQIKAELLNQDPNLEFRNDCLTRYIKITGLNDRVSGGERVKVTIYYNRAVIDTNESNDLFDGTEYSNLPYSPSLMAKVIEHIRALENTSQVGSLFGTSLATGDILDEDLTGQAPENYVRYERHEVNTAAGINLIMPAKGSFYRNNLEILMYDPKSFTLEAVADSNPPEPKDIDGDANLWGKVLFFYTDTTEVNSSSVHVTYEHRIVLTKQRAKALLAASNGATIKGGLVYLEGSNAVAKLRYGSEYVVDSIDIPRTERASTSDAVYQNIRFITPVIGEVLISYQAFGGFVATDDIRALQQDIYNTRTILTKSGILTSDTLPTQPFLLAMYKRLTKMEEFHRHFGQVEHRISIDSAGFHWINIAQVYDVAWGKPVSIYRDTGTFRIQSALRRWSYEFTVDLDMSKPDASKITIRTLGTNQDATCDYKDFTRVLFQDQIAARLCWIGDGKQSGLVLQVGWDFSKYHNSSSLTNGQESGVSNVPANEAVSAKKVQTDTILVTNKSGTASMWTLYMDPDQVNFPANGIITVYNHNKYKLTTDTTYQVGKTYYVFKDLYMYRRTADAYIKEGKTYYTYNANNKTYYEVDSTDDDYLPGKSTAAFIEDILDTTGNKIGEGISLYERILYSRYGDAIPDVMTVEDATENHVEIYTPAGYAIEANTVYEVDTSETFSGDDAFVMPSGDNWTTPTVENQSCKFCAKLIEPVDGALAWIGNINLTKFAKGTAPCDKTDDPNYTGEEPSESLYDNASYVANPYESIAMFHSQIQGLIKPASISGITMVVFDRLYGRYVTCDGKLSLSGDDTERGSVGGEVILNLEDMCFCKVDISKILTDNSPYREANYVKGQGSTAYGLPGPRESGFITTTLPETLLKMSIEPFLGSMSRECNRFDLRQIRLHF